MLDGVWGAGVSWFRAWCVRRLCQRLEMVQACYDCRMGISHAMVNLGMVRCQHSLRLFKILLRQSLRKKRAAGFGIMGRQPFELELGTFMEWRWMFLERPTRLITK